MASGELAGDDALVMAHSVHGKLDLIRSEVQQILANQALLLEAAGVRPAPPRKVSLVVPGNVPELPPVGVPLKATVVAQGGKTVHLELQDFGSQIYQHRMDSLEDAANLSQATVVVILKKTMGRLQIRTLQTAGVKRRRRAPRSDSEEFIVTKSTKVPALLANSDSEFVRPMKKAKVPVVPVVPLVLDEEAKSDAETEEDTFLPSTITKLDEALVRIKQWFTTICNKMRDSFEVVLR